MEPSPDLSAYLESPDRLALVEGLGRFVNGDIPQPAEAEFARLALALFAFQFERCPPYARLARSFGIEPPVTDYRTIPPVPTDAFKFYRMACFPASPGEIGWRTSGTSLERPGSHFLPTNEIYDSVAMAWLEKHLLDAGGPRRFFALTGSPHEMPHSSLVHMIDAAGRRFGESGKVEYFFHEGVIEMEPLLTAIGRARADGAPVLLFTTAFALVHFLEAVGADRASTGLPSGSRIMETGGFKGRSRVLSREELYRRASRAFETPVSRIVNQYGMTEMSSQFYDSPRGGLCDDPRAPRIKFPPPWVRSTVLDPVSLNPVADGEIGVLRHFDLANIDSCAFLLTADAARRRGDGFELLGRLDEAEPRGCSLDYESAIGAPEDSIAP